MEDVSRSEGISNILWILAKMTLDTDVKQTSREVP